MAVLNYTVHQNIRKSGAMVLGEGEDSTPHSRKDSALYGEGGSQVTLQGVPMLRDTKAFRFAGGIAGVWLLVTGVPLLAQQPNAQVPPAKASTLEDSVQALVGEVKQLNATVLELRSEISRSR